MINKLLNKTKFVMYPSEVGFHSEVTIVDYETNLKNSLLKLTMGIDDDMMVVRGTLSSAKILPKEFKDNVEAFIVYMCEDSGLISGRSLNDEGFSDPIALALEITNYAQEIDINDIYVIYGYRIRLALALNSKDIREFAEHNDQNMDSSIEKAIKAASK